jgi:hypothetical protein
MRARTLFAAGLLLVGAATAHAQSVSIEKPSCVPQEDNGVVWGNATATPGQTVRLYFRWKDHEDFYWVAMEPEAGGRFWATPPKPEKRNEQVELYSALVDPDGRIVARSASQSASQVVKVTRDCKVQLNTKQLGVAQNLTVGETSPKQEGKKVLGFLCDGVVTRVNYESIRRADGVCRSCVIAWWQRKGVIIPAALLGGGLIVEPPGHHHGHEPSPSRP